MAKTARNTAGLGENRARGGAVFIAVASQAASCFEHVGESGPSTGLEEVIFFEVIVGAGSHWALEDCGKALLSFEIWAFTMNSIICQRV